MDRINCRFCDDEAIAVFTLSRGCVCYPNDREQALCAQHIVRATPLGRMDLKQDLTLEKFFEKGGQL